MDQVFTALDRRQAMLLLTTVAFGGQEALPDFEHLPAPEGALLRHRAEQLLEIPREKRIPLLIHELKRRMAVQRSQLLSAEPQALAALLASERQAVAEVVLRALPSSHAEQVRALLPPITVKLQREVRPDVINAVRWKLEARLSQAAAHLPLRFVDVLLFEPRDHYGLCDRLGARVLGPAIAGLTDEARATFDASLTPDQRALSDAAAELVRARALNPDDAAEFISIHQGDGSGGDALRSAGAQRLARACIAQSPELAARILEKHRSDFGQIFMHWVREERSRSRPGDGGRTEVLAELEAMVREGVADRPLRAPPRKVKTATPPPPAAAAPEPRRESEARGSPAPRRPSAPGLVVGAPATSEARGTPAPRRPSAPGLVVGPPEAPEAGSGPRPDRRRPAAEVPAPRRTGEGEAIFRPRGGTPSPERPERTGDPQRARGSGQRAELRPSRREEPSRPKVTGAIPEVREARAERRDDEVRGRPTAGQEARRERRAEGGRPRVTGAIPELRSERGDEVVRPRVTGAIPEIRAGGREEGSRPRASAEVRKPSTSVARPRVTGAVPTTRRPTGERPDVARPAPARAPRPSAPPDAAAAASRPVSREGAPAKAPSSSGAPLARGPRKPAGGGKPRSQEFRAVAGPRRPEAAAGLARPFPTGRPRLGALARGPAAIPPEEEKSVAGPPPPRRDPIAERAARAGGAVSLHPRSSGGAKPRDASLPRPRGGRKGPATR